MKIRTKLLPLEGQKNSLLHNKAEEANHAVLWFVKELRRNPHVQVDGVPIICHHGMTGGRTVVVMARPHGGIAVHQDVCCSACERRLQHFPIEHELELDGVDASAQDGDWDYTYYIDGPLRVWGVVLLGVHLFKEAREEATYDPSQLSLWSDPSFSRVPLSVVAGRSVRPSARP